VLETLFDLNKTMRATKLYVSSAARKRVNGCINYVYNYVLRVFGGVRTTHGQMMDIKSLKCCLIMTTMLWKE